MSFDPAPLSKTAKYKKITKPLLERKRRARINRCLDELKDLMVGALEIDDDNLSKLEKADILELTVNHLTKLHSPKDPVIEAKKFQAGFGQCAAEACRFIMSVPDLDENVSQNLVSHLSRLITSQPLSIQVPERPQFSPPHSPSSVASDRQNYYSDQDRSDAEDSAYSGEIAIKRQWSQTFSNRQPIPKTSPIVAGLLTTVDRIASSQYSRRDCLTSSNYKNDYFNKVPAEAKDAILKKIRQHIMDKRGNDVNSNIEINANSEIPNDQHYMQKEVFKTELTYPYSVLNIPNNCDTLDLRKVRSPVKLSPGTCERNKSPESQISVTAKVEVAPKQQEECLLPMDFSNLPPKKKRKLIEYQEHKRQEEAKRQLELENESNNDIEGSKWRPW